MPGTLPEPTSPGDAVKAALVTGANRGLGYALVHELRERGLAPVIGTFRDPGRSQALLGLARADDGVVAVPLDVTSDKSVADAVQQVEAVTCSLAVVVNNAGIKESGEPILAMPLDEFRCLIETHALGALRVVRGVLPLLGSGSAVGNISSVVAGLWRMNANYAGYAPAKALQNALTRSLAGELRDREVAVLAFHPGWVATDMGGPEAPVTPKAAAAGIVDQLLAAQLSESGTFRDYLGQPMGW